MQIRARGSAFATGIGNWLVSTIWSQVSPIGIGAIDWKVSKVGEKTCLERREKLMANQQFYFVFIVWNVCITIPTISLLFKETKKLSLEEIDLLFGERALGNLPDNIHHVKIDPETKAITPEVLHHEVHDPEKN